MSATSKTAFGKLLDFLARLRAKKVHFHLAQYRDEAIMVEIATPGYRWEVEFFEDQSVEVERFVSQGGVQGESLLREITAGK